MRIYAEVYYNNLKRIQSHNLRNFLQHSSYIEGNFVFDLCGNFNLLFFFLVNAETNETIWIYEFKDNKTIFVNSDEKMVIPFEGEIYGS